MVDSKPASSNIDSIEEYLKNKYQFLNDKSPYTHADFLQKQDEKNLQGQKLASAKKISDDTLDITIFRDLQLNEKNPEPLFKKYENLNKDLDDLNFDSVQPEPQKQAPIISDPKINKLLADVENIVQKATGKQPSADQPLLSTEPKFGMGSKFSNKRNADIENQEIRAYLKNLDSKLNILVPKKQPGEKENQSKKMMPPLPPTREAKTKPVKLKNEPSFSSSDEEISPNFQPNSRKRPNSSNYNRNSVVREEKKSEKNSNTSGEFCSPRKNNFGGKGKMRNSRTIFEKLPIKENKMKEINDMDRNLTLHSIHQKAVLEMENNVFCVNCEEFINESKIDAHSAVCNKSSNHNLPNSDNHYNSLVISSNDLNQKNGLPLAGQIKNVNERLNKTTNVLMQIIQFFENLMGSSSWDPILIQQIVSMLAHFLDLTITLIHNKDPIVISQILKSLHELFLTLTETSYITPDMLQILQKIKQYGKEKFEILDPNNSYYNAISSSKPSVYNPINFQRGFSAVNNLTNRLNSIISDTVSQSNLSYTKPSARGFNNNVMNSPSDHSNNSDFYGNNQKVLKKKFFDLAISMKLALPKGHPGNSVNLSDLFLECTQMKLAENKWEEFLEQNMNLRNSFEDQ